MYQLNKNVLFLIVIFQSIFSTTSNAKLCAIDLTAPVNLSPPDIADIVSFIQSQYTPNLVENVLLSNFRDVQEVKDYEAGTNNEDIYLPITQFIKKYGYNCEEHEVETADGYLLTMQRIKGNGPVVFIQHGLTSSADDWITTGPKNGFPYILADNGYDVWLGNARGNKHSQKHVSLSPECAEFWDFSWDEIGRYDLPAMIDYALKTTGKSKLNYVGHSQGTTAFFVMCSMLPEYNDKISIMIALSPVAWMSHLKSPVIRLLALGTGPGYKLLEALGLNKFFSNEALNEALTSVICGNTPFAKIFCSNFAGILFGFDYGHLNVTALPVIFGHYPSASSTKQMVHYAQLIESARFCRFDYGESANEEEYNSPTPPDYPVEKITAPLILYVSESDWLSNTTDVSILISKGVKLVDSHIINDYSHMDFLWAKDANSLVYASCLGFYCKIFFNIIS